MYPHPPTHKHTHTQEEQRDLANTIRVSGSILLSTVSNFLDYFKLEAGKRLDIVRREVDMYQLVADVHCIIEAMIGRGTDLRLLPPDLTGAPQTILGDVDRLCGILLNLYTNAAKFTKRGWISLRVRVVHGQHTAVWCCNGLSMMHATRAQHPRHTNRTLPMWTVYTHSAPAPKTAPPTRAPPLAAPLQPTHSSHHPSPRSLPHPVPPTRSVQLQEMLLQGTQLQGPPKGPVRPPL